MNTETFVRAGIRFDFCRDAVVPEIPCVQDVLFVLRCSDRQRNYDFCAANHATYVVNVAIVVAAVGYEVLCMECYDEAKARKIIARAIVELCPPEARCLFNSAFVEAKELAGEKIPLKSANPENLRQACGCPRCAESHGDWPADWHGCED